jgi:mannose-6-phosphate isomerase-like protein (cupin superfamily)
MPTQPIVFNLSEAPTRPLRFDRGTQIRLFTEDTGTKNVDVHINVINADSGSGPYHYHERAENVYIVLDGQIEAIVEGKRYLLGKDDVAFIPAGLKHSAGAAGGAPARAIEIYAPAGTDFHIVDDPTDVVDGTR